MLFIHILNFKYLFVCHVCRRLICLPTAHWNSPWGNIQPTYIGFTYYSSILHILKYVLYNRISVFTHLVQLFIFKGVLEFSILDIYFLSIFHYSKVKLKKL